MLVLFALIVLVHSKNSDSLTMSKYSPFMFNMPLKKGITSGLSSFPRISGGIKAPTKALVVQIRSDQPVPLQFKSRPTLKLPQTHSHLFSPHLHGYQPSLFHHHHHPLNTASSNHLRSYRPLKLSAPVFFKTSSMLSKPLKIKLSNTKTKLKTLHKPSTSLTTYEGPFKYETPSPLLSSSFTKRPELQKHPVINNIYLL